MAQIAAPWVDHDLLITEATKFLRSQITCADYISPPFHDALDREAEHDHTWTQAVVHP